MAGRVSPETLLEFEGALEGVFGADWVGAISSDAWRVCVGGVWVKVIVDEDDE